MGRCHEIGTAEPLRGSDEFEGGGKSWCVSERGRRKKVETDFSQWEKRGKG